MQVIQIKEVAHHSHKFALVTWLSHVVWNSMGYPFGQLWSALPAVPPPNFLCTSNLLTDGAV